MCDAEAQVLPTNKIRKNHAVTLCLATIFHVIYFVLFVCVLSWGFWIWYSITDEQQKHPILKYLKILTPFYFTNWNFSFQTIFLGLSLLHDVLEWRDKHTSELGIKIKYWRDVLFCGAVLPFTLFVTGMFWGVYAIDRELVFPEVYDQVVPWWFNHCVHTNITVVVLIETLLQARRHPTNEKLELIIYWSIAVFYAVVYYTIYFITDRWLYQVFGVMTWWQVCLYQLFIWGITYVFYKMQFPINRLVHGSEIAPDTQGTEEKETADVTNGITNDIEPEVDNIHEQNGKTITDFESEPFATKTWSLKFRSLKSNFENSRL